MDLLSALIYGVLQGITEFLPVSSSGHLALLPKFLSISDPGVAFDLSMHVGTAFSVLLYYRKEVKQIFHSLLFDFKNAYFAKGLLVSTISTFVTILALKGVATHARSPQWIALNLIIFGVFMFVADKFFKQTNKVNESNYIPIGLGIGISQAFAIFPGVSRSGVTLTAARLFKLSRVEATNYSFLLSLPIIFAGFLYKLPELQSTEAVSPMVCLFGVFISFLMGLITIHFFLKFIKQMGLAVFTVYRVLLGLGILLF